MTYEEKLELARKFNKRINAGNTVNQINVNKMIKADELEAEDLEMLIGLYDDYEIGIAYKVGDIFEYENKLYKVIQEHTSLENWKPSELPALYLNLMPSNIIPDWKAPTGGHDAYKKGDKVLFNSKVYESLIDNNTWSPKDYPQGWKIIE